MRPIYIALTIVGTLVLSAAVMSGVSLSNDQQSGLSVYDHVADHQITPDLNDRELGIGEYGEQAHMKHDTPDLNDRELGIGEYGEQAHMKHDTPDLNDRELGIGEYGEQA